MSRKILSVYILIVLILISIIPSIYFFSPNDITINRVKPSAYAGEYHFYNSYDDLELFARSKGSHNENVIIFLGDGYDYHSLLFEAQLNDSLFLNHLFVFPDYRGMGKSERFKNPWAYSIENQIEDIESLRRYFAVDKIILIGHGFGSILAKLYENTYSNRVSASILISPIISYDESAKTAAKHLANYLKLDGENQVQTTSYFEMEGYSSDDEIGFFGVAKIKSHMELTKNFFYDTLKYTTALELNKNMPYSEPELLTINLPSLTIGLMFSTYKRSFNDLFKIVNNRNLVLYGQKDAFSGPIVADSIAKLNPKYSFIEFKNSAYFPYIEEADLFNKSLSDFLNSL